MTCVKSIITGYRNCIPQLGVHEAIWVGRLNVTYVSYSVVNTSEISKSHQKTLFRLIISYHDLADAEI